MKRKISPALLGNMLLFIVSLLLDRATKCLALAHCGHDYIINQYMMCTLTFNRGISWSLFDSEETCVFIAVSAVIVIVMIGFGAYMFQQYRQQRPLWAPTLVLAGACGNFADRILYHGVIDFISIGSWPVFNIADALICCGLVAMLMFHKEYL